MQKIGWRDYWRMFKARGWALPVTYFRENHLFDILRKTETHSWFHKKNYPSDAQDQLEGNFYMASWHSVIKESFSFLQQHLQSDFADYHFIDIGCGKEKAMIAWRELTHRADMDMKMTGIEYYSPLVEIAYQNYQTCFGDKPHILLSDIIDVDFSQFGEKLVLYMFNPLIAKRVESLLANLIAHDCIIIYNNPVHQDLLEQNGFVRLFNKTSWHISGDIVISWRKAR